MNNKCFFPVLVVVCFFSVLTQAQPTLRDVSEAIEKAEIFSQYREFKNEFESQTIKLASSIHVYEDYKRLNLAYIRIEKEYNDFLSLIKADLANYRSVKQMLRNPSSYVEVYAEEYEEVIRLNEKEFMPVYISLSKKYSPGKAIPVSLIEAGIELFQNIVDLIKKRKEMKEEAMNNILGVINKYFFDKLKMQTWEELGVPIPDSASPGIYDNSLTAHIVNSDELVQTQPVFENLNGWIEFLYLGGDHLPKPMNFFMQHGKDIDVKTLSSDQGQVVEDFSTVGSQYYYSTNSYGDGAQFQLKTYNSGGMYIFALNSGNKVKFLYPYENDHITNCWGGATGMKDIDLSALNSTPVVGKNENGITMIPVPDCTTSPPTDRYFTMTGAVEIENFCVVLTKTELNPRELAKQIESVDGGLHERVAKIFGPKMISIQESNLSLQEHKLAFDANNASQNVLPIVFYIKRR